MARRSPLNALRVVRQVVVGLARRCLAGGVARLDARAGARRDDVVCIKRRISLSHWRREGTDEDALGQ